MGKPVKLYTKPSWITYPVPFPDTGRQFVISDIHGCYKTLCKLLDTLCISLEDQVFFLGDYINKGPDSANVLKHIIRLRDDGYQIHALRGNHEQIIMQHLRTQPDRLLKYLKTQDSTDLLNSKGSIKKKYIRFLNLLPYYFELKDHWLVHAGFRCSKEDPFADLAAMLEIRDFRYSKKVLLGKTVIHGHVPHTMKEIEKAIKNKARVIPLDNGCVYRGKRAGLGNLLALNLKDHELTVQPKID